MLLIYVSHISIFCFLLPLHASFWVIFSGLYSSSFTLFLLRLTSSSTHYFKNFFFHFQLYLFFKSVFLIFLTDGYYFHFFLLLYDFKLWILLLLNLLVLKFIRCFSFNFKIWKLIWVYQNYKCKYFNNQELKQN